jgi:hypothetical protein
VEKRIILQDVATAFLSAESRAHFNVQSYHFSSTSFFFEHVTRCRRHKRLLELSLDTGELSVAFEESSDTFVDVRPKHKAIYRWLSRDRVVFSSERSGWNHLYVFDKRTQVTSALTTGDMVVRGLASMKTIHGDGFECEVEVSGNFSDGNDDYDPYDIHQLHIIVSSDGALIQAARPLTRKLDYGTHLLEWCPSFSRTHYIDTWSRGDMFPAVQLCSLNDGVIQTLPGGDELYHRLSAEKMWPQLSERFSALDRNNDMRIYGTITRPSHFDNDAKYPIIEHIYAGQCGHKARKAFSWWPEDMIQDLAELGFIVVVIDGLGTGNRSKAFLDTSFQNIQDGGFLDRRAWITAAAAVYPQMDLTRVGIYGTSSGTV